jgi:hypothetical protein
MDELDEAIHAVLIDGKPRSFKQILDKVEFSPNTLRQHPNNLVDNTLVTREKITRKAPVDRVSPISLVRRMMRLQGPCWGSGFGVVTLPFSKLEQICWFEKGGFCKKVRVGV